MPTPAFVFFFPHLMDHVYIPLSRMKGIEQVVGENYWTSGCWIPRIAQVD
jgi:hypothetical protein